MVDLDNVLEQFWMDCSVLCSVRTNGTEHKASFTSVFLEVGKVFDFEMSHSEFATKGIFH